MASSLLDTIKSSAPLLSVGALSANLLHLADSIKTLEENGIRLLHFDVMDGRFCPQFTAGAFFTKGIGTTLLKDVHLMVEDPLPLIPEFAAAGADIITVHAESGRHIHRSLQLIGELKNSNDPSRGILRGIALNPGTSLDVLGPLLAEVDLVFLLAINPGFPGQRLIDETGRRCALLKSIISKSGRNILIGIDGGITRNNIGQAAFWGGQIIVTGSAVFEGGRVRENLEEMRLSISEALKGCDENEKQMVRC